MISDTIVAPATPHGIGGIAVVRIGGPQSLSILGKLINNKDLGPELTHKSVQFLKLFDDNSYQIDETICTFFKSPSSYTGEDLVEVSCHGNPIIVEKIVLACIHFGARMAEPGEFTQRAYVNGKMDLIQAEAVASLIHAKSEESSVLNLRLLSGELSSQLSEIRDELINIASLIEFELDISEDDLQPNLIEKVSSVVVNLQGQVGQLLRSYQQARLLNKGALVVIAGAPNVGKSTLLNALSESDRAITSSLPGTTRDAIDVPLILDGVPINLVDTAGIREAREEIEQEGVRRSVDYLNRSDLIISVHDLSTLGTRSISPTNEIPIIEILNKVDLMDKNDINIIENSDNSILFLSAKTGENIDILRQQIKKSLGISSVLTDTLSIINSRQQIALKNCEKKLNASLELLKDTDTAFELLSIEIREALDAVDSLLGKTTPDDILNNVFNHFCVGK